MGQGSSGKLEDRYFVQKVKLGEGAFASVWRGVDRSTGEQVAIKQMDRLNLRQRNMAIGDVENEIAVLKAVQHRNIIKVFDVFEDPQCVYLALEYCDRGDFSDTIQERGHELEESQAADWMGQICSAIAALHCKDICHRDVKPENFLVKACASKTGSSSESGASQLKLADFGLATFIRGKELLSRKCGTPSFMAPEVHDLPSKSKGYGLPADMWSVGVSMYAVMFGGRRPFRDASGVLDKRLLFKAEVDFSTDPVRDFFGLGKGSGLRFSEDARCFCRGLIQLDTSRRPTAEEALRDPWFCAQGIALQQPVPRKQHLLPGSRSAEDSWIGKAFKCGPCSNAPSACSAPHEVPPQSLCWSWMARGAPPGGPAGAPEPGDVCELMVDDEAVPGLPLNVLPVPMQGSSPPPAVQCPEALDFHVPEAVAELPPSLPRPEQGMAAPRPIAFQSRAIQPSCGDVVGPVAPVCVCWPRRPDSGSLTGDGSSSGHEERQGTLRQQLRQQLQEMEQLRSSLHQERERCGHAPLREFLVQVQQHLDLQEQYIQQQQAELQRQRLEIERYCCLVPQDFRTAKAKFLFKFSDGGDTQSSQEADAPAEFHNPRNPDAAQAQCKAGDPSQVGSSGRPPRERCFAMRVHPGAALLAALACGLSAGQECCPANSHPLCDLPPCPSGMECVWVGEEVGPPTCRQSTTQAPPPSLSEVSAKVSSGFPVGSPIEDPYGCSPKPCGDLPQLGPLSAVSQPTEFPDQAFRMRFEFAEYGGKPDAPLPDGRPMWRAASSLQGRIQSALNDYDTPISVQAENGSTSGVALVVQIGGDQGSGAKTRQLMSRAVTL